MINRFQCKGQDVAFTVCFKRVFLFIDTNLLIYLAMNHSVLLFNATAACLIIFHIWVFWVRRHFRHRENINCISFVRVEFFVSTWCRKAPQKKLLHLFPNHSLLCTIFVTYTFQSLAFAPCFSFRVMWHFAVLCCYFNRLLHGHKRIVRKTTVAFVSSKGIW